MSGIPKQVESLSATFSIQFAASVWSRFVGLLMAAILVQGRKTVWRFIPFTGNNALGHFSSFHRVFSHRRWSSRALAKCLATTIVEHFAPAGVLELVGDDTVSQHRGEHVYGKGCHRDAVRSSHTHLADRWGHKWVVLSLRVRVPGTSRTWALPLLVALSCVPEVSEKVRRRHKTPAEFMQGLLATWLTWFPQRKCTFSGDAAFATHRLSQFAATHKQLTLVSKFVPTAVLHEPPPPRQPGQNGRPRIKGERLPSPQEVVASHPKRRRLKVAWYGGGTRLVEIITGTGHWYRQGQGLVEVRWVYVHDLSGHHRDESLYSTDPNMGGKRLIESFVGRWDIEVTFEEMREHLGLETTRGRCEKTILRVEPCLFLLYTIVTYWYAHLPQRQQKIIHINWPGKQHITFSDAILSVRRNTWSHSLFPHPRKNNPVGKLTSQIKNQILNAITLAG
ncbi:MAG: transposase [Planctomycetaceae bacterium]